MSARRQKHVSVTPQPTHVCSNASRADRVRNASWCPPQAENHCGSGSCTGVAAQDGSLASRLDGPGGRWSIAPFQRRPSRVRLPQAGHDRARGRFTRRLAEELGGRPAAASLRVSHPGRTLSCGLRRPHRLHERWRTRPIPVSHRRQNAACSGRPHRYTGKLLGFDARRRAGGVSGRGERHLHDWSCPA